MFKFKIIILVTLSLFWLTGCGGVQVSVKDREEVNVGGGGLFLSINDAKTWRQKVKTQPELKVADLSNTVTLDLLFDPFDTQTLYLFTQKRGLWVSYNSGHVWQSVLTQNGSIKSIAIDPQDRHYIYASKNNEIYRSVDGGNTWKNNFIEAMGNAITAITVHPKQAQTIFAITSGGTFFVSNDFAESWQVKNRSNIPGVTNYYISSQDPRKQYLLSKQSGIHRSFDGGLTWVKITSELAAKYPGSQTINDLKIHPTNDSILYLATNYGLLKTKDSGQSWQEIKLLTKPQTNPPLVVAFSQNGHKIYYATKKSFFYSKDGGKNWITRKSPTARVPTLLKVDPNQEDMLYLGSKPVYIPPPPRKKSLWF